MAQRTVDECNVFNSLVLLVLETEGLGADLKEVMLLIFAFNVLGIPQTGSCKLLGFLRLIAVALNDSR